MRKRKTTAERDQERLQAEEREWERFKRRVSDIQTFNQACELVAQAPSQGSAGRRFYSNLGFFLHTFGMPNGANETERGIYATLLERFDNAGNLKPGARAQIEASWRSR